MSVIDKSYREKCWSIRDNYWKCLDGNKEDKEKCLKLREQFEASCPATWVTHFDQKREYDLFKRQLALGQIETETLKSIKEKKKPPS